MIKMEKILEAANRLGHLLAQNDIVKRYTEILEKLHQDEESKNLLDEYIVFLNEYRRKEEEGTAIEVEDKKKLADLNEKVKKSEIINEFMATQGYYMNIMQQVNEKIARPEGDPPKESSIITPDDDKRIII